MSVVDWYEWLLVCVFCITVQHPTDGKDAKYYYDVGSLRKGVPPRKGTNIEGSDEDRKRSHKAVITSPIVPAAVAATYNTTLETYSRLSLPHTPSTSSGEVVTYSATTYQGQYFCMLSYYV